jgi:hypothetical protein
MRRDTFGVWLAASMHHMIPGDAPDMVVFSSAAGILDLMHGSPRASPSRAVKQKMIILL